MNTKDLENRLLDLLEEGSLTPHARFLSRIEIAEEYGASLEVVNTAVKRLTDLGRLYAIPGKGSFVSPIQSHGRIILVFSDRHRPLMRVPDFARLVHALVRARVQGLQVSVVSLDETAFAASAPDLLHVYPDLLGVVVYRDREILITHGAILGRKNIPCVFYGSDHHEDELGDIPALLYREDRISDLAVSHLMKRGHRRLGMVRRRSDTPTGMARYAAFRRSLGRHDLDDEPDGAFTFKDREEMVTKFAGRLARHPDVTGLFCFDDLIAVAAFQGLEAGGRRIPRDLGVVGVNDDPVAEWLTPPLTTVSIPFEKDAERMVRMLMGGERGVVESELKLVIRKST